MPHPTIEHMAYQVADPVALADWYVQHLGFTARRSMRERSPYAFFLADASGRVMIEVYHNPAVPVPDYHAIDPRQLHLAFQVADVADTRRALLQAGAVAEGDIVLSPDGDQIAMLRDPWGLALQLVKRAVPMV